MFNSYKTRPGLGIKVLGDEGAGAESGCGVVPPHSGAGEPAYHEWGQPSVTPQLVGQTKSELTESFASIRRMASASNRAIDRYLIFVECRPSLDAGIESVTTTSSRGDSSMRCSAGPLKTPW